MYNLLPYKWRLKKGALSVEPIISKKDMTEEDIKHHYITPAVTKKWSHAKITMETTITDGQIILRGNVYSRSKGKRADYILYLNANYPIAIIEAKDNHPGVSHGLQQAMEYARMLDLPFAYSSNGDGFAEHDFSHGERTAVFHGGISHGGGTACPLQA